MKTVVGGTVKIYAMTIYNNTWLIEKFKAGEKLKYLFFWGHQPTPDGSITKSCFSQWWEAPFEVDGIVYKTAEHWMMAEKARMFNDMAVLQQVIAAKTPGEAKKYGRLVSDFDPVAWDEVKFDIVVEGNIHKFSRHPDLETFLIGTLDRILVEASPQDGIWGIGMAVSHADVENPMSWTGENLLGYALMEVRDALKIMNQNG